MDNLYEYWFIDELSGSEKVWFMAAVALAIVAGYLFFMAFTLPAMGPFGGLGGLSLFFAALAAIGSLWAGQPIE